jgi:pyruvate dehydrogenase E1 component
VIDYNRQSLDGVVREGLWARIEAIFGAFGWRVVRLKHGASSARPLPSRGRAAARLDRPLPEPTLRGADLPGRRRMAQAPLDDLGDQGEVSALLARRSDEELARLMENLGGHCLPSLCEAFDAVADDRPTVFWPIRSRLGHAARRAQGQPRGLMTPAQMAAFQAAMGVPEGQEWEPFAGVGDVEGLRAFLTRVPFFQGGPRRLSAPVLPAPGPIVLNDKLLSTQAGFGRILDEIGRRGGALADRIVTTSPDVTVSTNLGPWVNRRGLFARDAQGDTFRDERIPSAQRWAFSPQGQHIELGIAEMNLMLLLGAAGLSHSLFGERLIPVGTVYDPFVVRGLDALNYACYQDARFLLVGTPSGVTLAPEGGATSRSARP